MSAPDPERVIVGIDRTDHKVTLRVDGVPVATVTKGDLSKLLSGTAIYIMGERPEREKR